MTAPRIFVVDDEPGIVELCDRLLLRAGYSVAAFTNPREALEALKQDRADLLLVDIRMPELSGYDLINEARTYQPNMAMLAMTGYGTLDAALQALRKGVDGLILKPFERADLLQSVEQALSDSQQRHDVARMHALRPLFDVTEVLFSETRSERLTELILDAICHQMRCANAGFYLYSAKDGYLHLLGGRGKTPPAEPSNVSGGAIGRADAREQLTFAVRSDPNTDPIIAQQLTDQQLGAIICVPTVLTNIRTVIYAGRDSDEPPFREVDAETFLILARQASFAMGNAHLYEEQRMYVKRMEESQQALVQAEKLATAGRLTASIAHEINNPLQSLRNCLHLIGRADLPDDMRARYFEMTQAELDRLTMTVQRMLDFYRPSSAFQPEQLLDLLERVLKLLDQQLRERNIVVRRSFPAQLTPVLAINSQMQQVFINLTLNAFDAMPEGGSLWISCRQLANKTIEIIFQDSGHGVSEDIRATLFEPFVSTKSKGTGLGLSVSYDIITAHGGSLDLLTDRGPGACFRILLPSVELKE